MGRPPITDWHGTVTGYRNRGCKCDACRGAHASNERRYKARSRLYTRPTTVPAGPARERLLALRAEGMTYEGISREGGIPAATVRRIAIGDRDRVWARTAVLILAIELAPAVKDLVDVVVVERFIEGVLDWTDLSPAERKEAAVVMDRRGYSRVTIADRTRLRSQTLWGLFRGEDVA